MKFLSLASWQDIFLSPFYMASAKGLQNILGICPTPPLKNNMVQPQRAELWGKSLKKGYSDGVEALIIADYSLRYTGASRK